MSEPISGSMNEPMAGYVANVVPGGGSVARWDAGLIIVGGQVSAGLDLIGGITSRLGDSPTAGQLIETLRSNLELVPVDVDLAAAISTPGGLRVFVRGGAQARTETDELITGPGPVERDLVAPNAIWLGLSNPPTVQGHPALNLKTGVVTGSGAVLYLPVEPAPIIQSDSTSVGQLEMVPPSQASKASSLQVPARAIEGDFEAIDWTSSAAVDTREPLAILTKSEEAQSVEAGSTGEQVLGVRCSRNHFNNPKAGYCQVCGISMVHLTHRLVPGVRPTLGFMVFADGATYAVDREYLIGRMPEPTSLDALTALQTQDITQSVSRQHAELRLDGWDVYYTDLGSTNGSFLWDASARRWDPLAPNAPVLLMSGASVSVGRMTFVFEAASRAVENS